MLSQIDTTYDYQSDLIDALGGSQQVAELINSSVGTKMTSQHISMMRSRGIPWRYRPLLAKIAKSRKIAVPAGFLGY